jgi:hypothetical protein
MLPSAGASDTTVNIVTKQPSNGDKKPPMPFSFSQIKVLQVDTNDD